MYTSTVFSAAMLVFASIAATGPVDLAKRQTLIGCHAGGQGADAGCSDPAKPYCSCVTYTPCFTSPGCVGVYSYTCNDADTCPGSYKLKRDIADAQGLATRHALALENVGIPAA